MSVDADGNGTNETITLTDDPAVVGAANPTSFTVVAAARLVGTKSVSGRYLPGGAVTYTIVLANSGLGDQGDNLGDELTDVLPTELELTGASATSGTIQAIAATRTVTWNGAIVGGGSVTITVEATVKPDQEGKTVSNQASLSFDSSASGTNNASALTDDPAAPGSSDPTDFVVLSGSYYAVTPCRLVDTRNANAPLGGPALVANQERLFVIGGQCGIPATATAVALNVAVTATGGAGFATVWPDAAALPATSTINFAAGQARANNTVVRLGPSGGLRVVATTATHVIIDVTGYFR